MAYRYESKGKRILSHLSAVIALGIVSQLMQIVFLRELLMVFHGNELSFGIILAAWMLCVGTGSRIAAHFGRLMDHTGAGCGSHFCCSGSAFRVKSCAYPDAQGFIFHRSRSFLFHIRNDSGLSFGNGTGGPSSWRSVCHACKGLALN